MTVPDAIPRRGPGRRNTISFATPAAEERHDDCEQKEDGRTLRLLRNAPPSNHLARGPREASGIMIASGMLGSAASTLIRTLLLSLVPAMLIGQDRRPWHDAYERLHETHWIVAVPIAGVVALLIGWLMSRSEDPRKRSQAELLVTVSLLAIFGQELADQIHRGSPDWSVAVGVIGVIALIVGTQREMRAIPRDGLAGKPTPISLFDAPGDSEEDGDVGGDLGRARIPWVSGLVLFLVSTVMIQTAGKV